MSRVSGSFTRTSLTSDQQGLVYLAGVLPSDDGRSGLQGFG